MSRPGRYSDHLIVLGVIASIAIPVFSAQRGKARDAAVISAVRNTASSLASWSVSAPDAEAATLAAAQTNGAVIADDVSVTVQGTAGAWCVGAFSTTARTYKSATTAYSRGSDSKPCDGKNPYSFGIYNAAGTGFTRDATGTPIDTYAANARGSADEAVFAAVTAHQNAYWLADGNLSNTSTNAITYAQMAKKAGTTGTLVLYRLPGRDICGAQSAGGAIDYTAYRQWVSAVADALQASGAASSVSVVAEPDSLADNCTAAQAAMPLRTTTLAWVVEQMNAAGVAATYLDAGNSAYAPVSVIAPRLVAAGVGQARGFSTNISNYKSTAAEVAFAEQVRSAVGSAAPDAHYIVDISRNGGAPVPGVWCNNSGAGLGATPAAGSGFLDATLRIKTTGTSDGSDASLCGSGSPAAGSWHPAFARSLYASRTR